MSDNNSRAEYGNDSITALDDIESVRRFPRIYLGTNGVEGAKHTAIEIIGNALDEVSNGYGDKLEVSYSSDNSVRVRDYGRGVPMGWNSAEEAWNWYLIFGRTYAGGKYADPQEILRSITDWESFSFDQYDNLATVGTHGVGAAATQLTSEWFKVTSYRDGEATTMTFDKGIATTDEATVVPTSEPNGTLIEWVPDPEVFTAGSKIPEKWLREMCFGVSIVAGITVEFTGTDGETDVYKATSPEEFVAENTEAVASGRALLPTNVAGEVKVAEAVVALGPSSDSMNEPLFYVNKIEVQRGTPIDGFERSVSSFFNSYGSGEGVRLKADDFAGLITGIVNVQATKPDYGEGQTKKVVESEWIGAAVAKAVREVLESEQAKGTAWLDDLLDIARQRAELRIEHETLKIRVREVTKAIKRSGTLPEKFVSCRDYEKKHYDRVELWIAEGDSAKGSLVEARDATTQAIYPVRGKSLNLFKASIDQILKNREVLDLIQILGAGVDLGAGLDDDFDKFDLSKLRVGRVVIASDADKDGLHIRMLLTVLIWRLFPEIVKQGMLYVAESPLYQANVGGKHHYMYNDRQLREFREDYPSALVSRNKGLGEVNPDVLSESTMHPDTRRLVRIQFDPTEPEVLDVFGVLFGNDTNTRKSRILDALLGDGVSFAELQGMVNTNDSIARSAEIDDVLDVKVVTY